MFKKKFKTKFVVSTTQSVFNSESSNQLPLITYYTGYPISEITSFNRSKILNGYLENAIFFRSKKNAIRIARDLQKKIGGVYSILETV